MRELTEKDWLNVFDNGVIYVITDFQIQPTESYDRAWYPQSFKENCPPEIKAYMIRKFLELKKKGYTNERIGKLLYILPFVKEYNIPRN